MQLTANTSTALPHIAKLESLGNYIDAFQCGLSSSDYNSGLTGNGYPLEVSFTNRSLFPRYAIDPFCQILPAERRLKATLDLVEQDFQINICREQLDWLKQVQAQRPKYGAWLGLREKLAKVSVKLYVEVDPQSEQKYWPELSMLQPNDRCLTMLGYTPNIDDEGAGDLELYYRSRKVGPLNFTSLLSPIRANEHAGKLKFELESLYGRKFSDCLPGGSSGFSYAISANGKAQSLTLFIFCRSMFGRDRRTRRRFSELIEAQGLSPDYYLKLTEPSVATTSAKTQHGIFSITISTNGQITYGVGYCPDVRSDNDC